jgi:hypothetical protein
MSDRLLPATSLLQLAPARKGSSAPTILELQPFTHRDIESPPVTDVLRIPGAARIAVWYLVPVDPGRPNRCYTTF